MRTWNDKHRRSAVNLTLNAAFLQEIKEDNIHFSQLLASIAHALSVDATVRPRMLAELLGRLRDEVETHFALEEFYGYFDQAAITNPDISFRARKLQEQHEQLFLELSDLVEEAERLVYHETPAGRPLNKIIEGFYQFHRTFSEHEEKECELAMRLCNEEIGVGD